MRFRRLLKRLMVRAAIPRSRAALRHSLTGQRLQRRSRAVQRRVARLASRARLMERRAQVRHAVAARRLRAAFTRAVVAGLR